MNKKEEKNPFFYMGLINKGQAKGVKVEEGYNQFLINRALSLHLDTLAIVNEINMYGQLTDQMHFDYLAHMVDPRQRWAKWPKPKDHGSAKIVSEYYGLSISKAYDIVPLFDEETLNKMESQLKVE